jgi:cytochrome bd ubiquinol oxidase subunit I
MDALLAARWQMAVSFIFHIIFACIGIAMPWLMVIAEYKWIKTGDVTYRILTKAWSRGVAVFFAVGAVSGTVLSFELGLLWPKFMEQAGPVIGLPFSWEGTAFFLEAIALGVFLYGWDRVGKWTHLFSGMIVGLAGVVSGIFVVSANAWMNSPAGFDWIGGRAMNIDPLKAMFNKAWFHQALHMTIAAFAATCFGVAGLHAFLHLRHDENRDMHAKAIRIALAIGALAAIAQPLSGDRMAKKVAETQPAKLAAMESLFKTARPASLVIGGIPSVSSQEVNYGIHIPKLLSFLAHGTFTAEVIGLDKFDKNDWPPVPLVHFAFQIMVFMGIIMAITGVRHVFSLVKRKKRAFGRKWLSWLSVTAPSGFIAVEAGWMVTEAGRQPWIISGTMRVADSVTPMPGIQFSFFLLTSIYCALSFVVFWLIKRQIAALRPVQVKPGRHD